MKEEIFKEIAGYEGLYEVSNFGNVRSLKYGKTRTLKHYKTRNGYQQVDLYKNSKRNHHYIHRLVATAFIENPDNLPEINHKDEDKTNNVVSNLEWCDHIYNSNHGTRNERVADALSEKVVQLTLEWEFIKEWESVNECGRNGFDKSNVSACCNGKRKTHNGYRWMFAKDYYTLLARQSKGIPS